MTIKISDLLLEKYLLQELPTDKMQHIKTLLTTDPELQKRLIALEASNQSILKAYPSHTMAANIKARVHQESANSSKSFLWNKVFYGMAATALALIITIPIMQPNEKTLHPTDPSQTIRTKGDKTGLYIYRKTQGTIELLKNSAITHQGDLLQIGYFSISNSYGIILSIDGRGTVTLHSPENLTQSPTLEQYQKILLPSSYELDDAPAFERFFFITSTEQFQTNSILEIAQKFAKNKDHVREDDLPLKSSFKQLSVLILKGE